jgi:hypothetical protein
MPVLQCTLQSNFHMKLRRAYFGSCIIFLNESIRLRSADRLNFYLRVLFIFHFRREFYFLLIMGVIFFSVYTRRPISEEHISGKFVVWYSFRVLRHEFYV